MQFLNFVHWRKRKDNSGPYSIIMLLRSPLILSHQLLAGAAQKAYGVPYDGSKEMYCIAFSPEFTLLKAGPTLISIRQHEEPYLGDPVEVAKGFKDKCLSDAWELHRAWIAFELMNDDIPARRAYTDTAKLVAALLDVRCVGIYLPNENQFTIQEDGSAAKHLTSLQK